MLRPGCQNVQTRRCWLVHAIEPAGAAGQKARPQPERRARRTTDRRRRRGAAFGHVAIDAGPGRRVAKRPLRLGECRRHHDASAVPSTRPRCPGAAPHPSHETESPRGPRAHEEREVGAGRASFGETAPAPGAGPLPGAWGGGRFSSRDAAIASWTSEVPNVACAFHVSADRLAGVFHLATAPSTGSSDRAAAFAHRRYVFGLSSGRGRSVNGASLHLRTACWPDNRSVAGRRRFVERTGSPERVVARTAGAGPPRRLPTLRSVTADILRHFSAVGKTDPRGIYSRRSRTDLGNGASCSRRQEPSPDPVMPCKPHGVLRHTVTTKPGRETVHSVRRIAGDEESRNARFSQAIWTGIEIFANSHILWYKFILETIQFNICITSEKPKSLGLFLLSFNYKSMYVFDKIYAFLC